MFCCDYTGLGRECEDSALLQIPCFVPGEIYAVLAALFRNLINISLLDILHIVMFFFLHSLWLQAPPPSFMSEAAQGQRDSSPCPSPPPQLENYITFSKGELVFTSLLELGILTALNGRGKKIKRKMRFLSEMSSFVRGGIEGNEDNAGTGRVFGSALEKPETACHLCFTEQGPTQCDGTLSQPCLRI